ncbi:hypothetical protein G6F50_017961 [Rhizopus delemar]|uniref:Uncharacterized protein n=1 Tax=Rhizopus delemar TaxID=936053 RepID=A0A9P6XP08_9FUNG|nr:hypothetical protein G6F50_017961 [Rhizopus delemar]
MPWGTGVAGAKSRPRRDPRASRGVLRVAAVGPCRRLGGVRLYRRLADAGPCRRLATNGVPCRRPADAIPSWGSALRALAW